MASPEIAILVSSYQRPGHLRRALASIAAQRGVEGQFEVIVTDDGSDDNTRQMVQEFARSVNFHVGFTTHSHDGFQLARCRNEGVRASTAPYLLFLDGDCLIPPDHLQKHLACRQRGLVWGGHFMALDRETSESISIADVQNGSFVRQAPWRERLKIWRIAGSSIFYRMTGHPEKPKLFGNNIGLHRTDYERVNGYDENFVGWGCEDDDLRLRLRRAGVQVSSILGRTCTYHLWHARDPSAPRKWRDGMNTDYLMRQGRLTRCARGLVSRTASSLKLSVPGLASLSATQRQMLPSWFRAAASCTEPAEVEVVFAGASQRFGGHADCNLLVVDQPTADLPNLAAAAHLVLSRQSLANVPPERFVRGHSIEPVLQQLLADQRSRGLKSSLPASPTANAFASSGLKIA